MMLPGERGGMVPTGPETAGMENKAQRLQGQTHLNRTVPWLRTVGLFRRRDQMTLPGEMNLRAVSSPQSHLSTASSVNTANTQGSGRNEPPPRTDCNIYFTLRQQAASSFMYFFSVSGFGVEILPSCGSAVLSLWVAIVSRTVCPGQPTRGGYHKNQVWGWSWLQDCSLQLNRKAI